MRFAIGALRSVVVCAFYIAVVVLCASVEMAVIYLIVGLSPLEGYPTFWLGFVLTPAVGWLALAAILVSAVWGGLRSVNRALHERP